MHWIQIFSENLLSPAILFFALGVLAGYIKSDLDVPDSISRYLSIYLMMAIGFKGGAAIAASPSVDFIMAATLLAGVGVSFAQPFLSYGLLRVTTNLDRPTAAAIGGHYGSVSIVTFVTAVSFLASQRIGHQGWMSAVVALMEAPAILSALYIAHRSAPETIDAGKRATPKLAREIFTNGAILLLTGSFLVGALTGPSGLAKVEGFLVTPFQGILALFLLDMGLFVSRQAHHLKELDWRVALFGLYMPLIGASVGLGLSWLIGLDTGTGALFMALCASASYIAVPAAMRLALPQAKAGVYLPLSLSITFPFNILFGIPLYVALAEAVLQPLVGGVTLP
ncbi:MAG: sodium-dependent bicarbonate transport family permease [Aestuariivirgaceae bacterium]|nr:sodium-dependent bicarbonate transport family permease [Aestuariivirgaceae bacterium]